ncbi:MAG: hypothetical protein D6814_04480 [Calditrichaeota bacterium]|nr:MAG: hypothetical protein D6814_04480 [Calditrichota bacterium]
MKEPEIISALEKIIEQLGIELRYEKGDFKGGLCRVGEKQIFIINPRLLPSQKIHLMANELSNLNLSSIYIVPAVRDLIESVASKQGKTEA